MNRDVERSLYETAGTAGTHEVVVRSKWFGRLEQQQLDRELNLRREERQLERTRIARELHDTFIQGFIGVSMQLQDAAEKVPVDSPGKSSLCRALRLMQRVIDEGRDALQGLRSTTGAQMSLEQTLSGLNEELMPGCGMRLRIVVTGQAKELNPALQEQVYLIVREAVVNAVRHSNAASIEQEVEYLPRTLRMVVRDNGCGMDQEVIRAGREAHWGLLGMRERAESIGGQLRIWSRPGAGTEVEVSVPSHVLAEACV